MYQRRSTTFALAVVGASLGSLLVAGCGDPCSGLRASERDQQAAQDGYEVEREGKNGVECELGDDGRFTQDD